MLNEDITAYLILFLSIAVFAGAVATVSTVIGIIGQAVSKYMDERKITKTLLQIWGRPINTFNYMYIPLEDINNNIYDSFECAEFPPRLSLNKYINVNEFVVRVRVVGWAYKYPSTRINAIELYNSDGTVKMYWDQLTYEEQLAIYSAIAHSIIERVGGKAKDDIVPSNHNNLDMEYRWNTPEGQVL